jgi:hypothetical protein
MEGVGGGKVNHRRGKEATMRQRRDGDARPAIRVAQALTGDAVSHRSRSSWLVLAVAVLSILTLGLLRMAPAWASTADDTRRSEDHAVTRFDAQDEDDDDGADDDGTSNDGTGMSGTTGPSDTGSLTDGKGATGPTGNTGTYTDGRGATGPTGATGPDDGTLTDGRGHTGPTGNTMTATDGRG